MILGYHLDLVVKKVLAQFASTPQTFTDAVNSGPTVPSDKIAAIHATLFPGGSATEIYVGERYTEDILKKGCVSVEDSAKPSAAKLLGNFTGKRDHANAFLRGEIISETATLYVFHRSPDAARFLSGALCARLIASRSYFSSAGFLGWEFGSEGPIEFETSVVRGWLGVMARASTWTAMTRLQLPDVTLTIDARDPFVAPVGTTNDEDVPGGVAAETVA